MQNHPPVFRDGQQPVPPTPTPNPEPKGHEHAQLFSGCALRFPRPCEWLQTEDHMCEALLAEHVRLTLTHTLTCEELPVCV